MNNQHAADQNTAAYKRYAVKREAMQQQSPKLIPRRAIPNPDSERESYSGTSCVGCGYLACNGFFCSQCDDTLSPEEKTELWARYCQEVT